MDLIATLLMEILALIGTVLFIGLLVLVFRNPHRPQWLRTDFVQTNVAVVLVGVSCLSVAYLIKGLVGVGIDVFTSIGISLALPVAVGIAAARLTDFRERLRRADAGESPFYGLELPTFGRHVKQG